MQVDDKNSSEWAYFRRYDDTITAFFLPVVKLSQRQVLSKEQSWAVLSTLRLKYTFVTPALKILKQPSGNRLFDTGDSTSVAPNFALAIALHAPCGTDEHFPVVCSMYFPKKEGYQFVGVLVICRRKDYAKSRAQHACLPAWLACLIFTCLFFAFLISFAYVILQAQFLACPSFCVPIFCVPKLFF